MILNWLARAGLDGLAADMTVLSSTGPIDPLVVLVDVRCYSFRMRDWYLTFGKVSRRKLLLEKNSI